MKKPNLTLVIGDYNLSSWSMRPWLVAKATKLPIEVIQIRLDTPKTRAEIAQHSPSGRVPVLKIKNQTIWDSLAICETLAELAPEKNLWPKSSELRGQARAYASEMHSGFSSLRTQLSMDINLRMKINHLTPQTKEDISRIVQLWETALQKNGGPYLFGNFTIADAFYAPVVLRFQSYGIKTKNKLVQKYMEQILKNAYVKEWCELAKREKPLVVDF